MTPDKLAAVMRRGYVRVRRVLRHTGGGAMILLLVGAPCAFASALGVFVSMGYEQLSLLAGGQRIKE